jgi:hypothetical protein
MVGDGECHRLQHRNGSVQRIEMVGRNYEICSVIVGRPIPQASAGLPILKGCDDAGGFPQRPCSRGDLHGNRIRRGDSLKTAHAALRIDEPDVDRQGEFPLQAVMEDRLGPDIDNGLLPALLTVAVTLPV